MQRENFVFTIGYKDDEAIVDKRLKARYRKYSTMDLYEEGLIKPAVASAIFAREQGDDTDLTALISRMEADFGDSLDEVKLKRIYGISGEPADISRILLV